MKKQSTILYILTFIVLAAVLYLVFFAVPGAEIDTVPVILPVDSGEEDESKEPESAPQLIEVTPDSVQTVIRTMNRANSYSRSICSESFWSGGDTRRNIDVWVTGDASKLEVSRPDGSDIMHILIADGEKTIWYSDSEGSFSGPAAEADADMYQALLSYERILDVDKKNIVDAGYEEYLGEMCIYVRYRSGELGYDNVCYVSLATGLVMGEESYDGDSLVIRVTSTVPELSQPDENIFRKP